MDSLLLGTSLPVSQTGPRLHRKIVTPKGMIRVRVPQYKLYEFIVKHYGGSITEAARKTKMSIRYLTQVVNKGVFGNRSVYKIVSEFGKKDPGATYESLFTKSKFVPVPRKEENVLPNPIRPKIGSVHSIGTGLFSRILERNG